MKDKLLAYSKVDKKTGCRIWTAQVKDNFPVVRKTRSNRLKAHFVAYEIWVGKIPSGMRVIQSCANRICINPDHLMLKKDPKSLSIKERLLAYSTIDPETGCRVWIRYKDKQGYGFLHVGGRKGEVQKVHRLMWQVTFGEVAPGLMVRHMCNNPSCINVEHLALGTNQDNMDDKVRAGRQARIQGSKHSEAKLTEDQVRSIRNLHSSGLSYSQIAKLFGISKPNVAGIVRRERWSHVT
jgi:hypothetical protein